MQEKATGTLSEEERILHVLNRFTPGATPDLVSQAEREGLKNWFDRQLKGDLPEPVAFQLAVKEFETLKLTSAEIFDRYDKPVPEKATEAERKEAERRRQIPTRELLAWVLLRAVYSANAVREVSCDFFRNHFSVSIDKDEVRYLVVDWEREVIFRRALANFPQILEASAHHPAMLIYLDNHLSRRPPTASELKQLEQETARRTGSKERAREAVDIAKQRGLNENYARELMELHTLGVDKYYTQNDVIAVAKCLTGWTIKREGDGRLEFFYNRDMHSLEKKLFLNTEIPTRQDTTEGDWILKVLSAHKGTALFLSWKLCRWLVHDEPNEAMVKRIAQVFLSTHGDLPKVFRAILDDSHFFARENFLAKFKRPWEYAVSALRATQAEVTHFEGIEQRLHAMNEPLYRCPDPTGYYDQAEAWRDPGAMATRWTFAADLMAGRIPGTKISSSLYKDLAPDKPREWKDHLVRRILPVAGLEERTSANLDRLIDRELSKNSKATAAQLGPIIVASLLGSPEFQKQ